MVIVKNEIELSKYFRKNLINDEIIIGMGAGFNFKMDIQNLNNIMTLENEFIKIWY